MKVTMRQASVPAAENDQTTHGPVAWSVTMTEAGLVCGAGSVLARMTGEPTSRHLALKTEGDRLLAMLSVIAGEPVKAEKILHHVKAASAFWERGDKALANLRLVFAKLPRPGDPAKVERLALTERLLDDGLAPDSLMKALWPQPVGDALNRYNPAQPRVPAGHGVESGRWEFAGGSTSPVNFEDGPIVVAAGPDRVKGNSYEDEKSVSGSALRHRRTKLRTAGASIHLPVFRAALREAPSVPLTVRRKMRWPRWGPAADPIMALRCTPRCVTISEP